VEDVSKTEKQLISELMELRRQIADLEALEAERVRAEEAAVRAKEEWENTFDSVPDLIAILNDQYQIVRANKAMADRVGATPQELAGLTCHEIMHNMGEPPPFCPHALLLVDGQEHAAEIHEENLDGDFLVTVSPLHDAEGRVIGSVHVARDITERKRTEEALGRLVEELDAFAHNVAHELRSPLNVALGFADLLVEDHATMSEEELESYLGSIARAGYKMSSIIDELLLLADVRKAKEVEIERLDMASIVAGALERLTYTVEELQAEITLPDTWPTALGYAPWVEEVWVNYLSNALRYGGQPPRVELGATKQENSTVRFWVRDNGPGIAPEKQDRLFAPFTQPAWVHAKGHGLGLSIVQRIVERLGGEVGVESEVGQGSTFFFTLPAG
jgi:PAS domain S-box-containing protein